MDKQPHRTTYYYIVSMRSKLYRDFFGVISVVQDLLYSYPFAIARYVKHDVIHKPEVRNTSQRRQIKMEPQTQKKTFTKFDKLCWCGF